MTKSNLFYWTHSTPDVFQKFNIINVLLLMFELFMTHLSNNWCLKLCLLQEDKAFVLMSVIFQRTTSKIFFTIWFNEIIWLFLFFKSPIFYFLLLSTLASFFIYTALVKHNLYSGLVAFSHSLFSSSKFVTSSKECCCRVNLFKKLDCQIYRIFQEKNPQYTITLYNVENIVAFRNCM